jgi:putative membrane protein
MTTIEQDSRKERFEVHVTAESHFSWIRTRLSLERTLMSWVRTAVSLIGFGFTIVQFFDRLGGMKQVEQPMMPDAPRYLGLSLIAAGILALLISVAQFRRTVKYISHGQFTPLAGIEGAPVHTPIYAVSIALIFIGIFAFIAVLTRAL